VVCVKIATNRGVDARRALAALTETLVLATHHIHIGRRTAEVAEIAFEVRHLRYLPYLTKDALFGETHYELALMGRDSTESAPAKASAVDAYGVAYHIIGRYALASILRVRQTRIGKVEGAVYLLGGHRWERRLHHRPHSLSLLLHYAMRLQTVTLLLNMSEILSMLATVGKTIGVGVKEYAVF
jgi:hypothetical protein